MFGHPDIKEAYDHFRAETELFGYKNGLKDKIEFLVMYFRGDYDYINNPPEEIDLFQ